MYVSFYYGEFIKFLAILFLGEGGVGSVGSGIFYTLLPNLEVVNAVSMGNTFGTYILGRTAFLAAHAIAYVVFVLTVAFEIFDNKECR